MSRRSIQTLTSIITTRLQENFPNPTFFNQNAIIAILFSILRFVMVNMEPDYTLFVSKFYVAKPVWNSAVLGPVYMGKTPHLPDPGLTGEVTFSHCLHEMFHLTCQPGAKRRGGLKCLFREIRKN